MTGKNRKRSSKFRPRARLLQLLGDQLIGSAKLAVFELVKNAYDADASQVTIELRGLESDSPSIVVSDDGLGMALNTVENVWLVPGDDFRERQRLADDRSPKFGRLPLGEKGVGRFAVHKLGNQIEMVTRASRKKECVVNIRWSELMEARYLDQAKVRVAERSPQVFTEGRTGTTITISDLREKHWSRRDVRDLYRQLNSISSPFGRFDESFKVELVVDDHPEWIRGLPDARDLVARAPWKFTFEFNGNDFTYTYEFRGVPSVKVEPRLIKRDDQPLQIIQPDLSDDDQDEGKRVRKRKKLVIADAASLKGIGPLKGEFYVFDRDREILSRMGETQYLTRFLDQNGGVRVYRDGVRVYNYGEPGDDWLGLDLRRVNSPTRNISRNIVLGIIELDLKKSASLREKTNREGFVENDAYTRLQNLVLGALAVLETERRVDKQRIRGATGGTVQPSRDLNDPISQIRKIAVSHGISEELEGPLRKIELDYKELRDNFLRAGLSQVGLALVFHEVERGVNVLFRAISEGVPTDRLRDQAGQIQKILETSTELLKKGDKGRHSLKNLIQRARDMTVIRLRAHGIKLQCAALDEAYPDTEATFAFGLALGALTNLIDNAIHWLKVRYPNEGSDGYRRIFIGIEPDFNGGPAIVVADNGPGFLDDPDILIQPFFSRRPEGMGLGLYYANLVMGLNGGSLAFPSHSDIEVPPEFDGAITALVFDKG